jgi:hypothetical protein
MAMFAMFQAFWSPQLTGTIGTAVEEMESEAKLFFEQHFGKPWLSVGYVRIHVERQGRGMDADAPGSSTPTASGRAKSPRRLRTTPMG